jgi:PAS domain S-box-containing protein
MDTQEQDLHRTGPEESEEYGNLFENAQDAVLTLTAEGALIHCNPAFERLTGWGKQESVGTRLEGLLHPGDVPRFRDALLQASEGKQQSQMELRIRSQSGIESVLECRLFGVSKSGKGTRVIMISRDISGRKQKEEDLIESDAKLRSILESANDAIVFIGSNLEIMSWNRAAQQIFGHFEDTPGRPFESLLAEQYRETFHTTIEQLREGGETLLLGKTLELAGLRADGTQFPLELSLAVWMFRGNPIFAAIIRDITKRKSAEASLQKKTGHVQLIQEIAIASNAAANPEDAMRYTLERICVHSKWPIGHVILIEDGKPVSTDIWCTKEENKYDKLKRAAVARPVFSETSLIGGIIQNKKSIWIEDLAAEKTFVRADAAAASGLKALFAFPVLKGSEVVAILEFFSDILGDSDREMVEVLELAGTQLGRVFERAEALKRLSEAEGRFRQLVESINAIVWRRSAKSGDFSFVSHQAEKTLGYPLSEWTLNPNFWEEHIHPEDRAWVLSFAQKEVEQKRNHEFDYRMIAADGRAIWMRNIVRVVVENDEPRELIGVMIDLTERKKAEDEIRQSRERLRALSAHLQFVREQERIKIAREVHDDLGQVLSALRMELSLLNQNLLQSADTAQGQQIMQELGTMSKLVDDTIRSVRRIITELRPEVLDHLDLSSALEWQIQEFRARTGIKTTFQSTVQNSPLNQEGVTAIFRILQETITNVSRHAQASAVQVKLIDNDDSIILEVKDNGRGITEEETKKTGSFGILGMRERVLLLGGTLTMKGIPGKGTTVRVEIPLSENR